MKRVSVLAVAAVLVAGCGDDAGSSGGLQVTATTTQVGDLVRNVGGERVDVTTILRPGADPHDFEPRPSDAKALADSRVVCSGGQVDDWLDELIEAAGGDELVVDLIDSVRRRGDDSHWWQDPGNAELAVAAIRDALIDAIRQARRATGAVRRPMCAGCAGSTAASPAACRACRPPSASS